MPKTYEARHFKVTDEAITPTGRVEAYLAETREQAIENLLYFHRLHDRRAWKSPMGVVYCPTCGTGIAVKNPPEHTIYNTVRFTPAAGLPFGTTELLLPRVEKHPRYPGMSR